MAIGYSSQDYSLYIRRGGRKVTQHIFNSARVSVEAKNPVNTDDLV